MEFRTQVPIRPQKLQIDYDSNIVMIGSCFVENMGRKLAYFQFSHLLNPFGVLFHPRAILTFLENVRDGRKFTEEDVFYHDQSWRCFEAHSELNANKKDEIICRLNAAVRESHNVIRKASHLVLTLGTAWSYRLKDTGQHVANCHKVPQKNFEKVLLDAKEDLLEILRVVQTINPSAAVIFTVSPVRHLKDGFEENQLSKARLITAIHDVVHTEEKTFYFPAYELMMDELRDYRFYARDMVHPSQVAIDYIWEKFQTAWISADAGRVMKRVDEIRKGLAHRPFHEASEAHQRFKKDLRKKIEVLQKDFPRMNFDDPPS